MKTMKKLCLCILALILVSVTVFGFTACGNNENEECVHEWGEWETVTEPTCVAAGKEKEECCCDCEHYRYYGDDIGLCACIENKMKKENLK